MGSQKKFLSMFFFWGISLDPIWDWLGYKEVKQEIQPSVKPVIVTKTYYYLSTLIYCGPQQWSFWLNDKKYTYQTPHPDKSIKVFSDHIEHSGISVFPDQTFEFSTKTVQDGDNRFDENNNEY